MIRTLIVGTFVMACIPLHAQDASALDTVRAYADAMIDHGRDTYGNEASPMFAASLDRDPIALMEGEALQQAMALGRSETGIRPNDRTLTGANPMHDENLYQVLYALTKLTGDDRYRGAADDALRYFWTHCQSPNTGLMAWGEHIGWDFRSDDRIQRPGNDIHEYFRPWILWEESHALAPGAVMAFSKGVWDHQIGDHETGNFSRHAQWSAHGPGKNSEYPRHGGFYMATWASAYAASEDPVYVQALTTLLDYFNGRRNEDTGIIPSESASRSNNTLSWPASNLSLTIDLHNATPKVPDDLADKMRATCREQDALWLKLPHDLGKGGKGFVTLADCATLGGDQVSYANDWATGYGDYTSAQVANMVALRYAQNENTDFRDQIIACADRYVGGEPDTSIHLYPGTFGDLIWLMLNAHAYTGDSPYLEEANRYAALAESLFLEDAPIPAATSKTPHYEAITRADTLMMALLRLWCVQNDQLDVAERLMYTDR